MESWKEELYHAARGVEWKNHKYIRKIGNRYIYPEDLKKSPNGSSSGSTITRGGNSVLNTQTSATGSGVLGGSGAGNVSGNSMAIDSEKIKNKETIEKIRARGNRRVKNVTGKSEDFDIKGKGLGTGPVGNVAGYSGRPGTASGDTIKLEDIGSGSSGGSKVIRGRSEITRSKSKSVNGFSRKVISKGSSIIRRLLAK